MASFINIYLTVEDLTSKLQTYCELCSKTFKNSSAYKMHRVKQHKLLENLTDEAILRKKTPKIRNAKFRYFCPVGDCKYVWKEDFSAELRFFPDRRSLKQHYDKVHTEKRFLCSICGVCQFSLERDKRYHEKICGRRSSSECAGNHPKSSNKSLPEISAEPAKVYICQPFVLFSSPAPVPAAAVEYAAAERLLLPKPNSSWRCFVQRSDACVQVGVDKYLKKQRPRSSTVIRNNPRDTSTQCDVETYNAGVHLIDDHFSRTTPSSSYSLHLYDEIACQTSSVQTFVAAVQSVVPQSDIFCQTNVPSVSDAAVTADIGGTATASENNFDQETSSFMANFDESSAWSTNETQTDDVCNWGVDFDDIWRHMQTQTNVEEALFPNYQQNTETQTSLIDFLDSAFQSAGTQT